MLKSGRVGEMLLMLGLMFGLLGPALAESAAHSAKPAMIVVARSQLRNVVAMIGLHQPDV